MLEIALVTSTEAMAQKISRAMPRVALCVTRFESLPQLATAKAQRKFDLLVVHHRFGCLDEACNLAVARHLLDTTPAIAIIPKDHPDCAVPLLNAGMDRCLSETFDASHFNAVVRALTRRSLGLTSSVIQYGALCFHHDTKRAWIHGNALELTKREAQVLGILLRRVGQIISKEDFIKEMDPRGIDLNATAVEVYIHRLRKKIRNDLLPIRSIKRCGYFLRRFVQPVEAKQSSSINLV